MAHNITFFTGFEMNHSLYFAPTRNGGEYWDGEFSMSSAQARNGTYSALLSSANGSTHSGLMFRRDVNNTLAQFGTTGGPFWVQFDLYLDSYGSTRSKIFCVGSLAFSLEISSADDKMRIYEEATILDTSTATFEEDKWYTISIGHNGSTSSVVKIRDAETKELLDTLNGTETSGGAYSTLVLGSATDCNIVAYYDNVVVESDASYSNIDDPFLLIGNDFGITALVADSIGTYQEWTGSQDPLNVDEMPHDGDTTYNNSGVPVDGVYRDSYGLKPFDEASVSNGPPGRIRGVIPFACIRSTSVTNNYGGGLYGVRVGGTDYVNTGPDASWYGSYGYNAKFYNVSPKTSLPWTIAEIEASEPIVFIACMFTAKELRLTQIGFLILHDKDYGGNQIIHALPV